MKNLLKAVPLGLAMVGIVTFAGCGNTSLSKVDFTNAEEITIEDFQEYINSDDVSFVMDGYKLTMSYNGTEYGDVYYKTTDADTGEYEFKAELTYPAELIGSDEDEDFKIYVTDGYLYMSAFGQDVYTSLDSEYVSSLLSEFSELLEYNDGSYLFELYVEDREEVEILKLESGNKTMFQISIENTTSDYYTESVVIRYSFKKGSLTGIYMQITNTYTDGSYLTEEYEIESYSKTIKFPSLKNYVDLETLV